MTKALLRRDAARRLGDALRSADYTAAGIRRRLGADAYAAYWRGDPLPLEAAARGGGPTETLTRLFLLSQPVSLADAARWLPLDVVQPLARRRHDTLTPKVALRPYEAVGASWWMCSDTLAYQGTDKVMPAFEASDTLASFTLRWPVRRALDLGTGCGLQALLLTRHADEVTATDFNERALRFARTTLDLNDAEAELVSGDRFVPVAGREFDLIVSNPPYVIGPPGDVVYRDSGRAGDAFCREVVRSAAEHLAPGGVAQILAQWLHARGQSWRDRISEWVEGLGCDALVQQHSVAKPLEHIAQWMPTTGSGSLTDRFAAWAAALEAEQAEGIGFGYITLRKTTADPVIVLADQFLDDPLGPEVAQWLTAQDLLRRSDESLEREIVVLRPSVRLEERWRRVESRWESSGKSLVRSSGRRRPVSVDDAVAEIAARCDGTRSLGDALSSASHELLPDLRTQLRDLVDDGYLLPAGRSRRLIGRRAFGLSYAVDAPSSMAPALLRRLPGCDVVDGGAPDKSWSLTDEGPASPSLDADSPAAFDAWPTVLSGIDRVVEQVGAWIAKDAADVLVLRGDALLVHSRLVLLPRPPGGSSGCRPLAAALERAGVRMYSADRVALDLEGRAHAWVQPPAGSSPASPVDGVPIAAVCCVDYDLGLGWQPLRLTGTPAIATVLEAVMRTEKAALAFHAIRRATQHALVLTGTRGEADEAAQRLVELLAG